MQQTTACPYTRKPRLAKGDGANIKTDTPYIVDISTASGIAKIVKKSFAYITCYDVLAHCGQQQSISPASAS